MKTIKQLCIKSYEITAKNGDYFKAYQGKEYITSLPKIGEDTVTVFSSYWVNAPKDHFVPVERK
jgi:hypothetical protein